MLDLDNFKPKWKLIHKFNLIGFDKSMSRLVAHNVEERPAHGGEHVGNIVQPTSFRAESRKISKLIRDETTRILSSYKDDRLPFFNTVVKDDLGAVFQGPYLLVCHEKDHQQALAKFRMTIFHFARSRGGGLLSILRVNRNAGNNKIKIV